MRTLITFITFIVLLPACNLINGAAPNYPVHVSVIIQSNKAKKLSTDFGPPNLKKIGREWAEKISKVCEEELPAWQFLPGDTAGDNHSLLAINIVGSGSSWHYIAHVTPPRNALITEKSAAKRKAIIPRGEFSIWINDFGNKPSKDDWLEQIICSFRNRFIYAPKSGEFCESGEARNPDGLLVTLLKQHAPLAPGNNIEFDHSKTVATLPLAWKRFAKMAQSAFGIGCTNSMDEQIWITSEGRKRGKQLGPGNHGIEVEHTKWQGRSLEENHLENFPNLIPVCIHLSELRVSHLNFF